MQVASVGANVGRMAELLLERACVMKGGRLDSREVTLLALGRHEVSGGHGHINILGQMFAPRVNLLFVHLMLFFILVIFT